MPAYVILEEAYRAETGKAFKIAMGNGEIKGDNALFAIKAGVILRIGALDVAVVVCTCGLQPDVAQCGGKRAADNLEAIASFWLKRVTRSLFSPPGSPRLKRLPSMCRMTPGAATSTAG